MDAEDDDPAPGSAGRAGTRTVALEIVAGLLVVGGLYLIGALLVPFVLALVLAIALSRPADWLRRLGLPATLANLLATALVAGVLATAVGLVAFQAGSILGQSETYFGKFAELLDAASRRSGGDRLLESLGLMTPEADAGAGPDVGADGDAPDGEAAPGPGRGPAFWDDLLRTSARRLGRWVGSGIGGAIGLVGGVIFFLSFLFYMLETRAAWVDRIVRAARYLGLEPRREALESVRDETVRFLGALSLVSLGYTVIVTLVLWAVGVPQPLLWGVLTGLLEFIPYFGPLIATAMPLVVSLSLGKWWAPLAVLGQYVALHTCEQYVITPLVYGKAVRIDPVLVLLGILFFGWLWGPLGLVAAMPALILLRGLLAITPDTPALDALVEADPADAPATTGRRAG